MKKINLKDLLDTINILYCSFFGIGFIYSESQLFKIYGVLFLFWTIFYVIYNRGNKL